MMRIAQITPRYFPNIGGIELVVKKISEELSKKGITVEVLTVTPDKKNVSKETINNVIVWRFPQTGPFHYSSSLTNFLLQNINKYDLVHIHNVHSLLPFCLRKIYKMKKSTSIINTGHYHGVGKTKISTLLLYLYRPILKKLLHRADGITCVSYYEEKLIKEHFGVTSEKIRVISNGVAVNEIKVAKSFQKNPGEKILLIVSRLEKYKNIQQAILAMKYLPKNYKLIIIGKGSYGFKLKNLTNILELGYKVQFLSRLSTEEVYRWYRTCDLVLNLSSVEAFGLTVLEGLAAEKNVLVNDKMALGELGKRFDNVIAVNVLSIDPTELAVTINNIIERNNIELNMDNYTWSSIAKDLLTYYKYVVRNNYNKTI